ncbi:hypothetical protein AB6A40_002847 [Gnathostoma spinigerum]|uniref:Major facilitator superfamily (MFS) profile domain-containing protein n=1 Tax=Gnathostoma spinigerum TaxID=75299 RepID=A0ABD6EGR2_9BILA
MSESALSFSSSRTLYKLTAIMIVDLIAFTCILPLFPSIIDFYSRTPHRDGMYDSLEWLCHKLQNAVGVPEVRRYNSVFFGGLLGSMFSMLQFFSSPLLGALSDIFGRKRILLLSVFGSLLSYMIWLNSSVFSLFVLSRIIGGLSKASVSIATTIIADVCPGEGSSRGMAFLGGSFSVGFIVGPMIGAYFTAKTRTYSNKEELFLFPAQFSVIMSIAELILIVAVLPETLEASERKKTSRELIANCSNYLWPNRLFEFSAVKKDSKDKNISQLQCYGLAYFFYLFLYSGLEFTLSFLTHVRFQYTSTEQGKMYLFVGLIMVFLQGCLVRRIPVSQQRNAARFAVAVILPSYIIIGISSSEAFLYGGLALYAAASAIVVPCITSCVSNLSENSSKGTTLGVFRSLGAFARALGPVCASMVFWLIGSSWCYVVGGMLLVFPYILLKRAQHEEDKVKTG